MEALNEFLEKIDFKQDTIFHSEDGKMYTSLWDKNGMYVCVGIYNSPFPIEKFILPPKTVMDMMSFATEIKQEDTDNGKILRIKSLEVNGTINLHDSVGREGAPKIEYIEKDTFIIKADMITKILRAQTMFDSKLLIIKAIPNQNVSLIVKGSTPEQHMDFTINTAISSEIEVNLGHAVYDILSKLTSFDVQVWVLNNKPVKFAITTNAFTVFFYVINE